MNSRWNNATRRDAWLRARRFCAGALSLAVVGISAAHCDNGAAGIEACREIESKRCEVTLGCPGNIEDEADVSTCKTFYRDQCLFGTADAVDPDPAQIDACLVAIDALASCKGAPSLAQCESAPRVSCPPQQAELENAGWCVAADPENQTACALLFRPEHLDGCSFLRPVGDTGDGSGGSGGAGGGGGDASGGAGGAGGAGGTAGVGGAGGV